MLPKNFAKCQGCLHRFDCIKLLASLNVVGRNDSQRHAELESRLKGLGFADFEHCQFRNAPDRISAFTNTATQKANAV